MCINGKAMPIINTNYNCHTTAVEFLNQSMGFISCHIKSLVINSLRDGHSHAHTYTHTDVHIENFFKKPGMSWPKAGAYLD